MQVQCSVLSGTEEEEVGGQRSRGCWWSSSVRSQGKKKQGEPPEVLEDRGDRVWVSGLLDGLDFIQNWMNQFWM